MLTSQAVGHEVWNAAEACESLVNPTWLSSVSQGLHFSAECGTETENMNFQPVSRRCWATR